MSIDEKQGRAENAAFEAFERAIAIDDSSTYTAIRKALQAYESARASVPVPDHLDQCFHCKGTGKAPISLAPKYIYPSTVQESRVDAIDEENIKLGLVKILEKHLSAFAVRNSLDAPWVADEILQYVRPQFGNMEINVHESNWQPIETAPRDGTDFLACQFFDNSNRRAVINTPNNGEQIVKIANGYILYHLRWNEDKEAFFDVTEGERVDMKYYNFWQPAPTPPAASEKSDG